MQLKICNQPLGLIYNEKTRLFYEDKTGGIVQAGGVNHAIANNKYMKSYDAD